MPAAQAMAESKCIVAIKCNGLAKTKKLKIFMQDKMYKVMDAYISRRMVDSSTVRFTFEPLALARARTLSVCLCLALSLSDFQRDRAPPEL